MAGSLSDGTHTRRWNRLLCIVPATSSSRAASLGARSWRDNAGHAAVEVLAELFRHNGRPQSLTLFTPSAPAPLGDEGARSLRRALTLAMAPKLLEVRSCQQHGLTLDPSLSGMTLFDDRGRARRVPGGATMPVQTVD